MAEVIVNATDQLGNPVQGASVRLYFNQPEGTDKAKGVVEGFTDTRGRFAAKTKTTYACHWRIEKNGFYRASGILPFSNHFSFQLGKEKRWTASPLQIDAILVKRSGAKLLHGFIGIMDLADIDAAESRIPCVAMRTLADQIAPKVHTHGFLW